MSNRAQRRADEAAKRRAPTPFSPRRGFVNGQARVAILTTQIKRLKLDELEKNATEKCESFLDLLAALVHEMSSAEKVGLEALAGIAGRALTSTMDERTRKALRQIKWPNEPLETIDAVIADEVVRRSVIRSDLALALSFTDRLTLVGYGSKLEGNDAETAMRGFYSTTLGAEKASPLRERLIAMRWRGANADTLEDLLIYGILDNMDKCVQLAQQFSILEDFERENPVQANEGFERRLQDEYNQSLWPNESAKLMYQITQRQARDHYTEYKDRVVNLTDRQITDLAKTIDIQGDDWVNVRPTILKLGWKGVSEQTINGVFMDAVLREIRGMARASTLTTAVARRYLAREHEQVSAGHVRCMEAVITRLDTLARPLPVLVVAVAFEIRGTVEVQILDEDAANTLAASRPEMLRVLQKALGQAEQLAISTRPEGLDSRDAVAVVLLTDAEGKHVSTCVSFTPAGERIQPAATNQDGWREAGALPLEKPKRVSDEIVADLNPRQRRCLQAIIDHAEALPRPLTKPWAILSYEDERGVHVVSDPTDVALLTSKNAPPEVRPYTNAIAKAVTEGLRDSIHRREPVIAVLVDAAAGSLAESCTWIGIDLHGAPITNPIADAPPLADAPPPDSAWQPARGPTFYASTFDRALMRLGAKLWQDTYAKGMTEDKISIKFNELPDVDPILGHFAAAWAVHAFQRLTTSHTYAAALMCTDADRESLSTIQEQWSAFSVIVPNGMLCTDSFLDAAPVVHSYEFTRILVAVFKDRAELSMLDFSGPNGALFMTIGSDAPTLPELLSPDHTLPPKFIATDEASAPTNSEHAAQIQRALTMAKRLVAGLLLSMQDSAAVKVREVARRVGRPGKRDEEEPAHRLVIVGQPIKIDCREAVETFIRSGRGSGGKKSGLPQVQWIVRGHWRQQAYGVGRLGRKRIWIMPHWAGKADAPILSRPKLVT